jgi:hypothetical protein
MKYIPLIALLLAGNITNAQDTIQPYKYSAKVYGNISRTTTNEYGSSYAQTLFHPGFAFQVMDRKGNAREFELTDATINLEKYENPNSNPIGQRQIRTNIAFRYERIYNLMKKRSPRLAPAIGYGIAPFYTRSRIIPLASSYAPQSFTEWGVKGYLIPRLTYNFNKRLYADINVPVCILSMSHNTQKIKDPALPAGRQKYDLTAFDMLPKGFSARLGLGIRF